MLIGLSNKESDEYRNEESALWNLSFFTIYIDMYVCPKDSTQCQEIYTS